MMENSILLDVVMEASKVLLTASIPLLVAGFVSALIISLAAYVGKYVESSLHYVVKLLAVTVAAYVMFAPLSSALVWLASFALRGGVPE